MKSYRLEFVFKFEASSDKAAEKYANYFINIILPSAQPIKPTILRRVHRRTGKGIKGKYSTSVQIWDDYYL